MNDLSKKIIQQYGNKTRIRVCGICTEGDQILLVRHRGLGPDGILWSPPGGGMEYGHSAEENLKRELMEETGLDVATGPFMFVHEFLAPPLQAIELFFEIKILSGKLAVGNDPEMDDGDQIIREVRFVPFEVIQKGHEAHFHAIFSYANTREKLKQMRGYHISQK